MKALSIYGFDELEDCKPAYALVANVDLDVIRYGEEVSVPYGRSARRGALKSDGHRHLSEFNADDLTSFKLDMCALTGVACGGAGGWSHG